MKMLPQNSENLYLFGLPPKNAASIVEDSYVLPYVAYLLGIGVPPVCVGPRYPAGLPGRVPTRYRVRVRPETRWVFRARYPGTRLASCLRGQHMPDNDLQKSFKQRNKRSTSAMLAPYLSAIARAATTAIHDHEYPGLGTRGTRKPGCPFNPGTRVPGYPLSNVSPRSTMPDNTSGRLSSAHEINDPV